MGSFPVTNYGYLEGAEWPGQQNTYSQDSLGFIELASGLAALSRSVTINSIAETPVFRYESRTASGETLSPIVGETLTLTGTGTDPTLDQSSPTGGADRSIDYAGANQDFHRAAGTSFADLTTEDIYFEAVVQGSSSLLGCIGKRNGSNAGWELITQSGAFRFKIEDSSATQSQIISAAIVNGTWYFVQVFVDRSGSGQIYINGSASGSAVSVSGSALTLANSSRLSFGSSQNNAAITFDNAIAYAALYARDGWLDTHLQNSFATARYNEAGGDDAFL